MKLLSKSLFALCLGSTVFLTTMATAHAEKITIDAIHAWPGHNHFYDEVAKEFNKVNPDIEIKFRASAASYDEGHQALLRSMITNQLPDIYFSGFHLLPELVTALENRKLAVDLTPFIQQESEGWLEANYEPSILSLGQVNGKQYGMAFNASTPIIFYNGDLVKEVAGNSTEFPNNWNDVIGLASKISELGDDINGMAYDIHSWPDDWLWRALIMEQGASVMAADGKTVAFDGEVGTNALALSRRFVTEGGMDLRDFDQSRQQFVAGKVGFIFSSPNGARAFSDLIGDRFELRSSVYPVADKTNGKLPTGGNAVMILAQEEKVQQAAWQFIKFATGPVGQKIAVLGSGYMPTNKIALEPQYLGEFYDENPNWKTSLNQIQYAQAWEGYPGNNSVEVWRTQRDIIGDVMRNNMSVEEGLEKIVSETNQLINK